MTYSQEVKAAAKDLIEGEDANWDLARLTYENTYDQSVGLRQQAEEGYVSMETWCEDVRAESGRAFSTSTGRRFKAVWREYGNDRSRGTDHSWADAYDEIRTTKASNGSGAAEPAEPRSDDAKASAAINALAVLWLRKSRGIWKPSPLTLASAYFLAQILSDDRQVSEPPKAVTDEMLDDIEQYLRTKAEK